ncbi:GILT-like protein 1 [Helicoverpa armigera]|uniref:GILT-like protein 1 n=1 Tax=Helicoverpa armigera TaxID=29058 RepID=UPI003083A96A
MAAKHLVWAAACFMLSLTAVSALQAVNGRIKLTIGTASGCTDTMRFVQNQLTEAYSLYGQFLDVEFVPWGRTVWNSTGFHCQFLENDCWANRLHRCVLDRLKGNQDAQVHYMTCEFSSPYPAFAQGTYICAQAVGVNLIDIDHCVNNPGDALDTAAQSAAVVPMQAINFVPYIMFNDVPDIPLHDSAFSRLASMICFALSEDPSTGITSCTI